jgi:hypothetical protein
VAVGPAICGAMPGEGGWVTWWGDVPAERQSMCASAGPFPGCLRNSPKPNSTAELGKPVLSIVHGVGVTAPLGRAGCRGSRRGYPCSAKEPRTLSSTA